MTTADRPRRRTRSAILKEKTVEKFVSEENPATDNDLTRPSDNENDLDAVEEPPKKRRATPTRSKGRNAGTLKVEAEEVEEADALSYESDDIIEEIASESDKDDDEDYVEDDIVVTRSHKRGGKADPVEVLSDNTEDDDDIVVVKGTYPSAELYEEMNELLDGSPQATSKTEEGDSNADNNGDDDVEEVGVEVEEGGFVKPEDEDTGKKKPKGRGKAAAGKGKKAPAKPRKKKEPAPKLTPFERRTNRLYEAHPELKDVFTKLEQTSRRKVELADQPTNLAVSLLNFQREGLAWMIQQEEEGNYRGGILADEMGMGKTIQMIALMMHDRSRGPNLVVAPTVALIQWKTEIETHTNNAMKVCLFHGASRAKSLDELKDFDVILTSYAVVESCYRKQKYGFTKKFKKVKEKSILHEKRFYRVILDEAHNIKDRTSSTAKGCDALNCEKRWCLSGTPLQNRIGELYSLIRFLDITPFCEYLCTKCPCKSKEWNFPDYRVCAQCGHAPMVHLNYFNHFMLKNIQKYGLQFEGEESFHRIQLLLRQIMIRRTKVERADDLGLPPKIVEIRRDYFNPEEKDLYQSLYTNSKRQFDDYVSDGVVLNNYANIFTLITRMRQLADHPDLVLKRMKRPGKAGANDTPNEVPAGVIICQLCDDESEEPIESKCHHKFCRICISEYVESFQGDSSKLKCPVCHIGLSIDLEAPALEMDMEAVEKSSIVNRIDMGGTWKSSTKVEALMEELYKSRSDRVTTKSIVFSQFTSMLDLVEWRLKRAGFETVKLQGSMTPTQRASTIKYFLETPSVEVFLVSLKAGGVALNLVEANQVFILDSWWNPSLDTGQAADRIHRIGQHRPIRIVKLVIEDSIESRIIELQEKKANMVKATLDRDEKAANQLTAADMQFLFNN